MCTCLQSFAEKPKTTEELNDMKVDTTVLGGCPDSRSFVCM